MNGTESRITSLLSRDPAPKSFAIFGRFVAPAILCGTLFLGGCQSSESGHSGESSFETFLQQGRVTVSPEAPQMQEDIHCPAFDIFEGGSAVRSGEGQSLRHQMSIRTTARECLQQANGSFTVNVGVEILALLGPAGKPGTFSAPLHIAIKRGNTVLSSRTRQISISIPAGQSQGITRIVEEGLPLPQDSSDVLIEIGLGSVPSRSSRR